MLQPGSWFHSLQYSSPLLRGRIYFIRFSFSTHLAIPSKRHIPRFAPWPLLTRRRRGTSADMVVQVCRLDNKHIIWGCIINLSTLRLLTVEDGARRGMKSLPHIIIIVVVKAPTNIRLLISCGNRCFGSSEAVVAEEEVEFMGCSLVQFIR